MWKIQDHQVVDHLRFGRGKRPGNRPTPIMPYDDRLLFSKVLDDRFNILNQFFHLVPGQALRFATQVVATLIHRHHLKVFGQSGNLLSPRVPIVRKTVNHDQERTFSLRHIMNFDVTRLRIAVLTQSRLIGIRR